MPLYEFRCEICQAEFAELSPYDPEGLYPTIACPCGSSRKRKLVSTVNLGHTSSKMDNFGYRAGHNMDRAKGERRAAEAASHMGESPYAAIDDIGSGDHFGEVK